MSGARRKLVFCFPYRGVGGVPLLFLRVAERLAATTDLDISLVDYADGFMARNVKLGRIRLLRYDDSEVCRIPDGATLVFQSMTPWSIFPSLSVPSETRLLFWNCYPYNLIPLLPGFRELMLKNHRVAKVLLHTLLRPFRYRMRWFTRFLLSAEALIFMDRPNVEVTRGLLGLSVAADRLVPIAVPDATPRDFLPVASPLRFCWIGRLADFKVHSLNRVLADLSTVASAQFPIRFDIIGDGPLKAVVEASLPASPFLHIRFLGNRTPSELETFLRQETDAVFAMGTSALEAARLGVPAVLLDISYREIAYGYTYRFLYDAVGYSLGDVLDETRDPGDGVSIGRIVEQLRTDASAVSNRCRDYFRAHHDVASVAPLVLESTYRTRLTWTALESTGFLKRPLFYRLLLRARSLMNGGVRLQGKHAQAR